MVFIHNDQGLVDLFSSVFSRVAVSAMPAVPTLSLT